MNIDLFIESLSDSKTEELKNYFIKQEFSKVKEQRDKFSDEICKREFLEIRLAGKRNWEELELILKENNLPIR